MMEKAVRLRISGLFTALRLPPGPGHYQALEDIFGSLSGSHNTEFSKCVSNHIQMYFRVCFIHVANMFHANQARSCQATIYAYLQNEMYKPSIIVNHKILYMPHFSVLGIDAITGKCIGIEQFWGFGIVISCSWG